MRFDPNRNHLAALLCILPDSVMILGSVKCNLSYDTGVAAFQTSVVNFSRIPRRTPEAPRPRCRRRAPLLRPWMSTVGDGEIESDAESNGPQDDDGYFDLKVNNMIMAGTIDVTQFICACDRFFMRSTTKFAGTAKLRRAKAGGLCSPIICWYSHTSEAAPQGLARCK